MQITRSGFGYNRSSGHFTQTLTLTNHSASSITGPISIAIGNLPANYSVGISGATLSILHGEAPLLTLP